MTARPVIGVVAGYQPDPHHVFPGYPRTMINEDYARSVAAAGGTPLLVPVGEDLDVVHAQLAALDGLLLTGGGDVDPAHFGQPMRPLSGDPDPVRDAFEVAALAGARERALPVLGICRGMQVINIACGGTLHQDLGYAGEVGRHQMLANPDHAVHAVSFEPGSFLERWTGVRETRVNSFHHQALDAVGAGLRVVARAGDGLVEAVEGNGPTLLAGVQWHPEMMTRRDHVAQAMFRGFVEACRR